MTAPGEERHMLRTRLCDLLGIDVPILAAPMGPDISSPELAAAVSNAGGLGLVSFGVYPPPLLRQLIRRMRELTDRPFGVNLILALAQPEQVELCIEERVPILSFAWGDPTPYVERAQAAGVRVLDQVGSVAEARRSAAAGADVIIAQGFEAGGHVAGTVTTMALVPRVVDAVAPVPVVAAGGIADARGRVPPWPWVPRASRSAPASWPRPRPTPTRPTSGGWWRRRRSRRSTPGSSAAAGPVRRSGRCGRPSSSGGSRRKAGGRSSGPTSR
jgi:hypothetical protein